ALLAVGAVVARLVAPGHRRLAHRVELFLRLVRVVGVAGCDQLLRDFAVTLDALGLVDRAFVVVQAQPVHRLQDRVDGFLGAALAVGVLDAQDELPAAAARLQPAVQRGARAVDVQVAGGAGGEAGAAGHGDEPGTGNAQFYRSAAHFPPRGGGFSRELFAEVADACKKLAAEAAATGSLPPAVRRNGPPPT